MTKSAATPLLALHQLSLYNTGRMSPEQVIAAFAARRPQFDRIVADLAAEKPRGRAQHHLVVGQRGMGKTMLLARIAAELRTRADLAERFIPLVFAEEQYAVDRLSKFWLNCLDSLADARELANDAGCVTEIDATVKRLTAGAGRAAKDDQAFADEVYQAFATITKACGQRPVLLVDNLQLVFERLDHGQQHSLRELLMRPGSPILVGASPSPPPESQDYGAAFYDQFKVHYLRPLDESEMRSLLVHLADASGRDDVRQKVLQHPARLTVLRQLTGGNPRTTLTLFFLYAEDFAPTVFGDLEGLLDRVTPLYKARFEELTAQQQVVASAIANNWDPVTAATLAATTTLPAGTISAQLDRLEKIGVVERTELFGETSTGYQLAERFFNIWFLMRSASRRQRREVEFLTRFLESFYEPTDRSRLARHLMAEDHFSADRYVWRRAVAASLTERDVAEELTRHAQLTVLREEACEADARLRELLDLDNLPRATLAFDEIRKRLMSLVPEDAGITSEEFAKAVLGDRALLKSRVRERLAGHVGLLSDTEIESVLKTIEKSKAVDEQSYTPEAVGWVSQRLSSGQIRTLRDSEDWNRALIQAPDPKTVELLVDSLPRGFGTALSASSVARVSASLQPTALASAEGWARWGHSLCKLSQQAAAENAYREAISRAPNDGWHWYFLGDLLEDDLNRFSESEAAFREAIVRAPENAWSWRGLGRLLQKRGRHAEAEACYREAISRDPGLGWPWHDLGELFQYHLARYAEAEVAYREAIMRMPDVAWPWLGLVGLYEDHLDRPRDAAEACDSFLQLEPADETGHQLRIFLLRDVLNDRSRARRLLDQVRSLAEHELPQAMHLQESLFAAYDSNWGLATEALVRALSARADVFGPLDINAWLRASAVFLHLNYGAELLRLLNHRGDTARLRPWVEALRAHHLGDRRVLQNTAPEIRTAAEVFYDGIMSRLEKLPDETRRRPQLPLKRTRPKRSSTRTGRRAS